MKKIIILTIGVIFVLSVASRSYGEENHAHNHEMGHTMAQEESLLPSGLVEENVRIVNVTAYKYGFDPDPIVVIKGEKVKLIVTSTDVVHGLAIKDFGVNVMVPSNEVKTIEFIADKTGDFHMHCSVYCGSGHGKMHGTLKVIE